jgi:hypothetical protein
MKTLIILVTVVSTVLFERRACAATPQLLRSDSGGIDGFELGYGGVLWWNTWGVCNGEFPNTATVKMMGSFSSSTHAIASDCDIMTSEFDNPVRDEAYVYFFAGRQLVRKSLNAASGDPHQNVATPPFSPTLPSGELGAALAIRDRTLYFARYTNSTGVNAIYSLSLDNTNLTQEAVFDANARVVKMGYFNYDDNRTVNALIVLTSNGRLYRIKLNPIRGETTTTLLATGVNDFVVRNGGFFLSNSYIFATKGGLRNNLGEIPDGGTGTFYRVHPETGAETLLYTAQDENVLMSVTAVGNDNEDDTYIFLAEGIVSGPPGGFQSVTDVVIRRHSAKVLTGAWDTILLQGGGENLRTRNDRLYFVRENAIYSIPTGSPAIQFDMRAFGVEAVQSLQSFTHSVPLIANRPTFVRGYASLPLNTTGQDYWFATATLRGFINGQELPGGPLSPINNVAIRASASLDSQRSVFTNSFLFELPAEWVRPGPLPINLLQFTLTVNPELAIPETVANPLANNSFTTGPINLIRRGKPCLVMTPVWSVGPEYYAVDDPEFPLIVERARTLMPVEDFDVHPFGAVAGDPDDPLNFKWEGSTADTQEERDEENRQHRMDEWGDANDQAEDLGSESDICDGDDIHYVAMVHSDAVIYPPGGIGERPGNAIAVRMSHGGDGNQYPRGGYILAEELGHNYGRKHIQCGTFPEDQANFDDVPFPESLGNPNASLPEATFGFDPLTFTVLRPSDACDVMGYGSPEWTTAVLWNALLGEVGGAGESSAAPAHMFSASPAGGLPPMVMLVRGTIFPETKTAWFGHFSRVPESVAPARNVARSRREAREAAQLNPPYLLRQLDGAGAILLDTAILARDPSVHEHGLRPSLRFSQYIDFDVRAHTLQLVWSNIVFAERFISPHAPKLQLGTPVLDPVARTISLNWTALDADGDPLRFSIHYTGDDGLHWGALQTDYKALSITLSTRWLAGGTRCRLRVIAHDGAHSTLAVTPPFACPKHAPEPSIHGIREGQSIPFGQPLRFKAIAFDAEEGSSLPTRFWQLLGPDPHSNNGDYFNIPSLAPGVHTLRFTAIDSDGQSNTVSRSFEVAPLAIPEAAVAPTLDGQPNDSAYATAAFVQLPFGTRKIPARLLHHGGYLYASIADLSYSIFFGANRTVGLRFDVNASRNATATAGDIGFFVDEDGVPYQEVAQGGSMVRTLSPQPGFTAIIYRGSNLWSAELQIADSLLGGWNHLVGLMIAHSSSEWPPLSLFNQPNTWAPVWLGAAPVTPTNKPPFAVAGSDVALSLSYPSEVTLNGSASYDPEGMPLSYAWQQIAGPAVTLASPNAALCEFTAPVVGANTEFRFRLTVNDGTRNSAPDEVIVLVRPPPTPAPPVPLRGFAELRDDGLIQIRLVGESARTYRVQTSTDLVSWSDFRTMVGDLNGAIDLTVDPRTFREPARFFRAVSP